MPGARRAVVTGAAGFIGSHLSERLLSMGYSVTGIDSFEDYYDVALKRGNLEAALSHDDYALLSENIVDLGEAGRLQGVLDGADVVFHMAAQAGVRRSWGTDFAIYTRNNIQATQMVLEAALAAGVPKVVYASSSSVYGDTDVLPMREDAVCRPFSPYGVTKLAGEHLAELYMRNYDLKTASFRFFTVYGPRQRPDMAFHIFMRAILEGAEVRIFGNGAQSRDFTYVSDIVSGLCLGLDPSVTGVFNLGGGSRVSLSEAIDVIEQISDVPVRRCEQPKQAGDVRDTWASLNRARAAGYDPKVRLADGLQSEWDWMRALLRG
jgi:nucleoside-diphosphate-sugar epimerase